MQRAKAKHRSNEKTMREGARRKKVENNLSLAPSPLFSRLISYFAKHERKTRRKKKKKKKEKKKKKKKPPDTQATEKCMPYICHDPSKSKDTYMSQVLRRETILGKTSSKRLNFRYVTEVFS